MQQKLDNGPPWKKANYIEIHKLKVMELSQDHNVIDIGKNIALLLAYLVLTFACLKNAKR